MFTQLAALLPTLIIITFVFPRPVWATVYDILYTDSGFEPQNLTVKINDTAVINNLSSNTLNLATSPNTLHPNRAKFDIGTIPSGTQASTTFITPGTHIFFNTNLTQHQGQVTVIDIRTINISTDSAQPNSNAINITHPPDSSSSDPASIPTHTQSIDPSLSATQAATLISSLSNPYLLIILGFLALTTILMLLLFLRRFYHPVTNPEFSFDQKLYHHQRSNLDPHLIQTIEEAKSQLDQWIDDT